MPRDTKGGSGHGSLIILAAEDVEDARRAVEVALKELDRTLEMFMYVIQATWSFLILQEQA